MNVLTPVPICSHSAPVAENEGQPAGPIAGPPSRMVIISKSKFKARCAVPGYTRRCCSYTPFMTIRRFVPYGWEANRSLSLKKAALMRSIIEASGQYQREPERPHLCGPLTMAHVLAIQCELSSESQKPFTGLHSHYLAATPRAQIIRPVRKDAPDDDISFADVKIGRPSRVPTVLGRVLRPIKEGVLQY